jgi:thiamine-monophosphate kinase
MPPTSEATRIAMLARTLSVHAGGGAERGIEVGIGDDAAVLVVPRLASAAATRLVWTIDEQVDGVHFRRNHVSWHDVGWRSFMAAASDLPAMGAEPWCALCALVLPDDVDDTALEAIAGGQRDAAQVVGAPVVGGNLSGGPALSIATTVLGTCERAVLRSGALPGDGLWVAGQVGLAAAGLRALECANTDVRLRAAVAAWRKPKALVGEGRAMARVAHAAVDVSDGLACDAGHVAEASGVRLVFDEDALRGHSALADAAAALGADALDLALYGGEDYALLVSSPVPIVGFRRVGDVTGGRGVALRRSARARAPGPGDAGGEQVIEAISASGYDHFSSRGT